LQADSVAIAPAFAASEIKPGAVDRPPPRLSVRGVSFLAPFTRAHGHLLVPPDLIAAALARARSGAEAAMPLLAA
jgi:hypothetical protein